MPFTMASNKDKLITAKCTLTSYGGGEGGGNKSICSKEINAVLEVFLRVNFYIQKCRSTFQQHVAASF